jgi:hypothetical protein
MSEVQEWDQEPQQQQQPNGMQLEEEEDDIFAEENDEGNTPEGALLMRFCPHDSSMLYPKVRATKGDKATPNSMKRRSFS